MTGQSAGIISTQSAATKNMLTPNGEIRRLKPVLFPDLPDPETTTHATLATEIGELPADIHQ